MLTAARIAGVEYLQNYPVLLGLMVALSAADWATRLLSIALGSAVTAATIALTERIKLGKTERERPADLSANALSFFAGQAVYLGYYFALRTQIPDAATALAADALIGLALGVLGGLAQAISVDERRLNRAAIMHSIGLALAAAAVLALIGALAGRITPPLGAALLCVPMTLIIVRLDYWERITQAMR